MRFSIENASKIKLVIWDLDETFWKGTLSDNDITITPIPMNIEIIKKFTDRGIINSVCSKNDKVDAEKKLEEFGVKDYFVFNSINWDPKGNRIKSTLASMALRPQNVLFIDDNISNLGEVEFVMPEIMVASPDIISELYKIVDELGKDDFEHSRLEQYKVLEKKRDDAEEYESNTDFLRQSNILIQYDDLNEDAIPRIAELIQRSNQLNFTKKRIGEQELRKLLDNPDYKLGYVSVSDNYGKYGIVGFYALDIHRKYLEHFLFSCRTMGMGIEQHVYATLNYPELYVVEPVSGSVSKEDGMPDYINRVERIEENTNATNTDANLHILLKGPCDLEVMASYLEGGSASVDKEFNFVDNNGNQADYFNHSINILNCNKDIVNLWCEKYSFLAKEGFETKLFSGDYDVICISPLMDATLALYEDENHNKLAFGLYSKPLTEIKYHKQYINKLIMTARSCFNEGELSEFAKDFRTIDYTPEMIAANLAKMIENITAHNSSTLIVILLLGELEYKSSNPSYNETFIDKHLIHQRINDQIKKTFSNNKSVYLLDVNKYIKSQSDYFDNINHYSKYVYYEMAQEFVQFIEDKREAHMHTSSKFKMLVQNMKRNVYKKLFVK
ncbi:MAG: HAD-IIIC family phosphatase [Eubacterium sp.]|nr:HAD-IIIC family phosphatase [Eubacterium sp.]